MARKKKKEKESGAENDKPESGEEEKAELSEEEDREEKLKVLFKASTKQFGDGSLVYAKDFAFKEMPRISTGIFPLDYALGGGLPVGRVSMFYGHKSSSKSTKLLRSVGNAQKCCSLCWTKIRLRSQENSDAIVTCACGKKRATVVAWLDVEGVWDNKWAEKFVNLETLLLSQPETAEQACDTADAMLRSGSVDIIVIDSIAFMTPFAEIEKSSADALVGVQARLIGGLMRKLVSGTNSVGLEEGRRPTVWVTNQIRMKVGVMFGNPETVSGGLAQGFATSCEVRTSAGKYSMDEVTGKPLSVEMRAKVTKNKTGPANMECEYKMVLSKTDVKDVGDIIDEDWAIDMGEKAGLVDIPKGHQVVWDGRNFNGKSNLAKHFMQNREDYEKFKEELMPVLLAA